MELITFDAQNSASRHNEDPLVCFNKAGIITINAAAVKSLQLEAGNEVVFHQDKKKKTDWYLEKRTLNGFKLRQNKSAKSLSLCFNCASLVKEIASSLSKVGNVKIPLSTAPTDGKYYALLTSTLNK